jgi:hypothetical protein
MTFFNEVNWGFGVLGAIINLLTLVHLRIAGRFGGEPSNSIGDLVS